MNTPLLRLMRASCLLGLALMTILSTAVAQVTPPEPTQVFPFAQEGRWGVIDAHKKVLCPPEHDYIFTFRYADGHEPHALALKNDRQGVINATGKWVIPARYDSIHYRDYTFRNIYLVQKDSLMGLVRVEGSRSKEICKPQFEYISRFDEAGFAMVEQNGLYGLINIEGRLVVEPEYDEIRWLGLWQANVQEPAIRLRKGTDISYVKPDGQPISADEVTAVEEYAMIDEAISFSSQDSYETKVLSLGNKNWRILITRPYDGSAIAAMELSGYEAIESVELTNTWTPKPIIAYIIAQKEGFKGMLDGAEQVLLPFQYDGITTSDRHQGYRQLTKNGKMGLARNNGQLLLPAVFDEITVADHLIYVRYQTYEGYADNQGRVYLPVAIPEN